MEVLDKKGRRNTFEALRKGYPQGWTYQELTDTYKVKSTYPNCNTLLRENIIKGELVPGSRRRDATKYYFEDYNYINNKKEHFRFQFAPGYVQYTEDFLDNYEKLSGKFEYQIYQIYSSLMDILKDAVSNEKQTFTRQQCKFCGYDHEMRDFMRATLLHLIDGIEEHDEFIDFILKEGIVTEAIYERPKTELRGTPSKENEWKKTAQKVVMKEQQSTRPMESEEQTAKLTTPHKQHKSGQHHTEEWKRKNSERMKGYFHLQEDIEKMRGYKIDDHAFDNLSAEAKYWIGYMMARGSIVERSSSSRNISIKFSVPREDRNHLERFKEFIKSDLPIRYHKIKRVCELEFRSRRILIEIEKYGIHNNMRYNEKVTILEDDRDFWRGFIDGNTSGRSGKFEISSHGEITLRIKKGQELILQFKTFADKILGRTIGWPIQEVKNWSLRLTDRNALELYGKLLYDKNSIALDRNLELMKQVSSLSKYKTRT